MIIELSLTAPEHAPLIEHYHELFHDNHIFTLEWNYPVLPRAGESFDEAFIIALLKDLVNISMLPHTWSIVDLKWYPAATGVLPRLYVVGK